MATFSEKITNDPNFDAKYAAVADNFVYVHGALRRDIARIVEGGESAFGDFPRFARIMAKHHELEEKIFFPALEARAPGSTKCAEEPHQEIENLVATLLNQKSWCVINTQNDLMKLQTLLISHLAEEEEKIMPLMMEHFEAGEIWALDGRIMEFTSTEFMKEMLPWWFKNVDAKDRINVAKNMVVGVPPNFLPILCQWIKKGLDKASWHELIAAVPAFGVHIPVLYHVNRHYAKQFVGLDIENGSPPSKEDQELYLTTVLVCAAADGELSDAERAFVVSGGAAFGNPPELLNKASELVSSCNVDELIEKVKASPTLKYTSKVITYHTLLACSADDDLDPHELDAVIKVASMLGLQESDVHGILQLIEEQKNVKEEIFSICWKNDSSWRFSNNSSHTRVEKPIENQAELLSHANRFYALFTCGINIDDSESLTNEEKEMFAAVLFYTCGADDVSLEEEEYILGFLTAFGICDDAMLATFDEIKSKWQHNSSELLEKVKSSSKLKALDRFVIYQAISASYADNELSAAEEEGIKQVADVLGVEESIVDQLKSLYERHSVVRGKLMHVFWGEKNPWD